MIGVTAFRSGNRVDVYTRWNAYSPKALDDSLTMCGQVVNDLVVSDSSAPGVDVHVHARDDKVLAQTRSGSANDLMENGFCENP